ncbi:MAG: class I SAM-dependent methyltransferase [Actinomycetia bacterium]|nr:class I SAM-dependent methyltransferase [Actinomycetes bacterium]MCP5032824.1 class I SAM-dependent methyltransferase [Actinomycetes bacterium]
MGSAYLRYSFTKGTAQEVAALIEILELQPGQRVLDVGCGPGRHALAMAAAGCEVVGIDISSDFIAQATATAVEDGLVDKVSFMVGDARALTFDAEFDAAISLCQGAFGLAGGPGSSPRQDRELDEPIMAGIASSLRPGGRLALSAFSAYFQLRYLEDHDTFDAENGVNHETTSIRNPEGVEQGVELWTSCFTPRELRLLVRQVGLTPLAVHGVTPGAYRRQPATIDCPEFLLVAERPRPSTQPLTRR